jgi:PilZ domain
MDKDRRSDERVRTNLPARWDGLSGGHEARIEDISLGGCFVNTTGLVSIGEVVVLQVRLPSGEWLTLRGQAATAQEGIGFGLNFSFITDEEEYALRELISNQTAY